MSYSIRRLLALSAWTLVLSPDLATARGFRRSQMPAAPLSCAQCHVSPAGGGPLTVFGADVNATLSGNDVDWPLLCVRDSDGDGANNGAELGDPGCTWRLGDPSRTGPFFNPSDPNSSPAPGPDLGAPDTGLPDTGPPDRGLVDTGPDTGTEDAGLPMDSGALDRGPAPDAAPMMDSEVDVGPGDAGGPDAQTDAGADDLPRAVGGGCRGMRDPGGSTAFPFIAVLGGWFALRRRTSPKPQAKFRSRS